MNHLVCGYKWMCVVVYSREVVAGRVADAGRPRPTPAAAEVGVAGVDGGRGVLGALPRRTAALASCSTTQHAHHATCLYMHNSSINSNYI